MSENTSDLNAFGIDIALVQLREALDTLQALGVDVRAHALPSKDGRVWQAAVILTGVTVDEVGQVVRHE